MKKHLFLMSVILFSTCWGCSSSGGSPDPIAEFRDFSMELKQVSHDAFTQAGRELDALADADPKRDDYLIAMEDLLIAQTYGMTILNKVINFTIRSFSGTVYTNTERDSTITVSGGIYVFSTEDYIFLGEADAVEKIHVTFTWDPVNDRWLLIGLRGGSSLQEPTDPWLKQEGEVVDGTDYYYATAFFFEEEGIRHINNVLLNDDASSVSIRMSCGRPACAADCIDMPTTPLFTTGVGALGLLLWNDFRLFGFTDPPDYEIP